MTIPSDSSIILATDACKAAFLTELHRRFPEISTANVSQEVTQRFERNAELYVRGCLMAAQRAKTA